MFYGCSSLGTASVTAPGGGFKSWGRMFNGCSSMTSATVAMRSLTNDLGAATSMFSGCTSLASVTLQLQDSPVYITNATAMFYNCSSLTTITKSPSTAMIDMTYCYSASQMFDGCASLTAIPTFQNTKSVTNWSKIFNGCAAIKNIPANLDLSGASSSGSLQNFIAGCTSLTAGGMNRVLQTLATWSGTSNKTLAYVGFSSTQATTCTGLSNWAALEAAGWTTGY